MITDIGMVIGVVLGFVLGYSFRMIREQNQKESLPHRLCETMHDEAVRISTVSHISFDEAFAHLKNCAMNGSRCSLKDVDNVT